MSERIFIKNDHQKDIQAYIDYTRIVGVDDGGKMMSEKEFEEYKDKVREARKNHLYVNWQNIKGNDCKAIGPESMCFCGHRYKAHNFDNVKTKKVNCKDKKCKCPLFNYVPIHGSNDIKCLCKHSYDLHDPATRVCNKCKCSGFGSKFTCNCSYTYDEHNTVIETREERQSQGKAVDPSWMKDNLSAGIGGLNSFSAIGSMLNNEINKYSDLGDNDNYKLGDNKKNYLGNGDDISNNLNNLNLSKKQSGNMNNNINSLSTNTCNMTNTSNTSNIINEDSAFNLFLTPHQYAGSKSGKKMLSGNNLSSNMGNISNVNNKMKSLNFK